MRDVEEDVLVYTVTCKVNGKVYVGITVRDLSERRRRHIVAAKKGSSTRFHAALREYGADAFTWEVDTWSLSWEEACEREKALIRKLGSQNPEKGYNMTGGGNGSLGVKVVLSEESRQKISQTLKDWHASDDPDAIELRRKASERRRGSKASIETRKKLAEVHRGRTLSPESRAKLSASKMQYPPEVRKEAVEYAQEHGYRAAARHFDIPRPTIRRWSKTPEERKEELSKMRARAKEKQYGYVFPLVNPVRGSP